MTGECRGLSCTFESELPVVSLRPLSVDADMGVETIDGFIIACAVVGWNVLVCLVAC